VGVTKTFKLIGVVFLVVICLGAFLIEKCPEGFVPEGWNPPLEKENKQLSTNKTWKEMLLSPFFYVMLLILMCGAFCGLMCISQASSIGQKMIGMSVVAATSAVSMLALFNATGRVLSGYISDKIGRINMLTIAFALSILGLGLLSTSGEGDVLLFYVGMSIIGFCFGSFMGVFPGFTADQFGAKNNSVNYGIMFIGFALSGYFGPTVMSKIYLSSQSYKNAFLVAMGISAAGILLTCLFRLLQRVQVRRTV
jgi:MFS family permease